MTGRLAGMRHDSLTIQQTEHLWQQGSVPDGCPTLQVW